MQILTVERAAEEPGYALALRHSQKWAKYGDKCRAEGIKFCPLIMETTGAWHPEAKRLLKRLGVALARATGGEEGEVTRHFFVRLSLLLQRDNVTMILSRTPGAVAPEIDRII